jgi:hypothetical protein
LVRVIFELKSGDFSQQFHEHVYVKSIVALRDYLSNIQTAQIGDILEFRSEEEFVVMTFTRQKATLRISGRIPNDGYFEARYRDFQAILEERFAKQIIFYCNFPLKNVPTVIDELSRVLQVIATAE